MPIPRSGLRLNNSIPKSIYANRIQAELLDLVPLPASISKISVSRFMIGCMKASLEIDMNTSPKINIPPSNFKTENPRCFLLRFRRIYIPITPNATIKIAFLL